MNVRWLPFLCLAMFASPALLPAGEKSKDAPPSLVLRVRSLDALLTHAQTIVALAGHEEIGRQVEGLIKTRLGPKGLEGIDTTRPFGFFARLGEQVDDVRGVLLVPIADQKALLGLLENLNVPAAKLKDNVYSIQIKVKGASVEGFFRFAHGYLYATALNASMLNNLPTPEQILGKDGPALGVNVRLDQLPKTAKLLLLDQLEQLLENTKNEKKPGETAAQKAFRLASLQEFKTFADAFFKDAAALNFTLDMDEKTNQVKSRLALTAAPGSSLAADLEKLGQARSSLSALTSLGDTARFRIYAPLPKTMHQALMKVVEEASAESLKALREDDKKAQAKKLIDGLMPSLQQGLLDFAMTVRGPSANNQFSALAAVGLKDGAKLGKEIHTLVRDALKQIPEGLKELIQLDLEEAGGVKIHRFEVPGLPVEFLGNPFQLHLAFRDDALFLATGPEGLKLIKGALAAQGTGPTPLFLYQADLGRALRAAPREILGDLGPILDKAFPAGKDNTLHIQVEAGAALTLSLEAPLSLIQYYTAIRSLEKKE